MKVFHRWRMQILMAGIIIMGLYLLAKRGHHYRDIDKEEIDIKELEKLIDSKSISIATYQPPKVDIQAWGEVDDGKQGAAGGAGVNDNKEEADQKRTLKYHRIWGLADKVITMHELFSDTPDVEGVLTALATAKIVHADKLDEDLFLSGTGEKWVITLEGGQKAMMKINWGAEKVTMKPKSQCNVGHEMHWAEIAAFHLHRGDEKGTMKPKAQCNFGHEMHWAEIAAFHLHRAIGFHNTPYATGRLVDLKREIFPVATPAAAKSFMFKDSKTCVTGKCYHCEKAQTFCPKDGLVEASVVYWVQHRLQLYTFAPNYMPFSTPSIKEWQQYGFNNRTYCEKIRKHEPYTVDRYYHDLFDFAIIDFLMYHYDSKHYVIDEKSGARGLTVRLDHGRAFCAHDHDLEHVFLAPLKQCCIMRRDTYWTLKQMRPDQFGDKLKSELARDPLAPILDDVWFTTLERRKNKIIAQADRCAEALGGLDNFLVG